MNPPSIPEQAHSPWLQPPDPALWSGREDPWDAPLDARFHHAVECLDLGRSVSGESNASPLLTGEPDTSPRMSGTPEATQPDRDPRTRMAFIGFCSDLGVLRNQGRPGASKAPDAIRRSLANLAWHHGATTRLLDAGNVVLPTGSEQATQDPLAEAQRVLRDRLVDLFSAGIHPIVLGGGHEVAKPHVEAAWTAYPAARIGIINIDAHFDLRRDPAAPTSGTPFHELHQLAMRRGSEEPSPAPATSRPAFDYLVIGIQPPSNTGALFREASRTGTRHLPASRIPAEGVDAAVHHLINAFCAPLDAVVLTICMDSIAEAHAPGVSAPAPFGLTPQQLDRLVAVIAGTGKLLTFSLAEANPLLDPAQTTLRTAAHLVSRIISAMPTVER